MTMGPKFTIFCLTIDERQAENGVKVHTMRREEITWLELHNGGVQLSRAGALELVNRWNRSACQNAAGGLRHFYALETPMSMDDIP